MMSSLKCLALLITSRHRKRFQSLSHIIFVTELLGKLNVNGKEPFKISPKLLPWESEVMVTSSTSINYTKR